MQVSRLAPPRPPAQMVFVALASQWQGFHPMTRSRNCTLAEGPSRSDANDPRLYAHSKEFGAGYLYEVADVSVNRSQYRQSKSLCVPGRLQEQRSTLRRFRRSDPP